MGDGEASDVFPRAAARDAMKNWRERVLVAALCAVVGWFYVWTVRSSGDPWKFGLEQRDYYNLLIDGWLDGQLHLKVEVPEALLQIQDPYDPTQRPPGLALHDASFFRGKYYVYFGAAPVVTLMLPFRLLTGIDLPLATAVLVFVFGGFLVSVALLLEVRRRYFPEAGAGIVASGILAVGLAGLGPVLLRRPHMWELPIGAGSCFALLALFCVWRSLHPARMADAPDLRPLGTAEGRRRAWWFAGAGLCLGWAIASRPTYLIAGPMLAVPLLVWWREERRLPWAPLLGALAPLLLIGTAMAWHNHARFGHPLQFGQAYQFSLDYESKMAHFRLTHAPLNLWRYFLSAAEWSPAFPFIRPADLPPKPPGYGGHGDVYGLFTNLPFTCLVFAVPLALWRRDPRERAALGSWLGTAGVLFAAIAGTLVHFFGSLARYQCDFAPPLVLLAAVGGLGLHRSLGTLLPRAGSALVAGAGFGAAVFSGAFAVLYSLQFDGLFLERNPDGWREMARRFNTPAAVWEKRRGVSHGALEIRLSIETAPAGTRSLLAEFGRAPSLERVWLLHAGEREIVVEMEAAHGRRVVSPPLGFRPGGIHTLRVESGALLPPGEHPVWSGLSASGTAAVLRRLRLWWDAVEVVEVSPWFGGTEAGAPVRLVSADTTSDRVRIVGSARDGAALTGFRAGAAVAGEAAARRFSPRGDVELRLTPPSAPAPGSREPLLVTGRPGRGDFVGIEYGESGAVRFFVDHWGHPGRFSPPVFLPAGHPVVVRITAQSLRSPSAAWRPRHVTRGDLRLEIDDREVWREVVELFVVDPVEVAVGVNPIGGTSCGPTFTGELHSVEWGRRQRP